MKIEQLEYHRNGVSGIGFHAIIFTCKEGHMVATVFPERGAVSIISLDRIEEYGVRFGANSWRGDHYESDLRAAIKAHNDELEAKYAQ